MIIHYWLREQPTGAVTLSILDADGNEVRSFTSKRDKTVAAGELPAEGEIQQVTGEEEVSEDATGGWSVGAERGGDEPLCLGLPLREAGQTRVEEPQQREEALEGASGPRAPGRVPGSAQRRRPGSGAELRDPGRPAARR